MTRVICPCCGNKESVADGAAGRRHLCSNCGTPFVIGAAPPPPAPELVEEVVELVPVPAELPPRKRRVPPPRRQREPDPEAIELEPLEPPPFDEPPPRPRSQRGTSLFLGLGTFLLVLVCGGIVGGAIWYLNPEFFQGAVAENTEKEPESTEKKPPPQEPKFADSGKPVILGDMRVALTSAAVDFISGTTEGTRFKSEDKLLAIRLRIENNGDKKLDYTGWGGAVPSPGAEAPRLTDDQGNTYKLVAFTGERRVDGQVRNKAIEAHRGVNDILVFELPGEDAETLKLELPARNFGGSGKIGFKLPCSKIGKSDSATDTTTSVPELIESLKDPDPAERLAAAITLASRGPASARASKQLGETLKDADPAIRKAAAEALIRIGLNAHDAYPALVRALGDSDEGVRKATRTALGKVGPPVRDDVAELGNAIKDTHPEVRAFALEALLTMELDPTVAAPIYAASLKAEERTMRLQAVRALAKVGPKGREAAFPALLAAMRDADAEVRQAAEQALAKLGPPAAGDVAALRKLLKESEAPPALQAQAARSLGAIPTPGKDVVDDLVDALKDREVVIRRAAAAALAKIGPGAKGALVWLIAALRDLDKEVRRHVLDAIGKMGDDAKLAGTEVGDLVSDSDPEVRKAAGRVLVLIDPAGALRAYGQSLFSTDAAVRMEAAEVLFRMGAEAKPLKADLITALTDKTSAVRLKVARTLIIIDPTTTAPVGTLAELLSSPDAAMRREASEALAVIGASAEDALPALTKALQDKDHAVRRNVVATLDKLGAKSQPALTELIAALEDGKLHEPIAAVLFKIGAENAVKPLSKLLESKDPVTRMGAVVALGKFGPEAAIVETAINRATFAEKDDDIKKAMRELMKQIKKK